MVANAAYLKGFPFPALLRVALHCVPGGVKVVSTVPSYRPTDHHDLVVELDLGQPGNEPEQGALIRRSQRYCGRGERSSTGEIENGLCGSVWYQ